MVDPQISSSLARGESHRELSEERHLVDEAMRDEDWGEDATVSSDEDIGNLWDSVGLPPDAWLQLSASHVPLLSQCARKLADRAARLSRDKARLRASFEEQLSKRTNYDAQCRAHLQEQDRCYQVLRARLDALEAENQELQARSEQQLVEQSDMEERSRETTSHQAETEQRIQRLMDQMVKLLSANPSPELARKQVAQVVQELEASDERLGRQLTSFRERYEAARSENRRAALHLSDEQQRTKKLHDALCQLQAELYGSCTHGAQSSSMARLEGYAARSALHRQVLEERPLAEGKFSTRENGLVAEMAQVNAGGPPDAGAGPHVMHEAALPALSPPAFITPPAQHMAGPSHMETSAVPEPNVLDLSPGSGCGDEVSSLVAAHQAPQSTNYSMEERLREVLEAVQFDSLVVRLSNGWYQFGDQVRASVRMNADGWLYASSDQVNFEALESFIGRVSRQETISHEALPSTQVAEDPAKGIRAAAEMVCGKMMDPSLTPPPVAGAVAGDGSSMVSREQVDLLQGSIRRQLCSQNGDDSWLARPASLCGHPGSYSLAPDAHGAMPTPPGPPHSTSRRAWSPIPQQGITAVKVTRVRSPLPRKDMPGSDESNGCCVAMYEPSRIDAPRSPQVWSRGAINCRGVVTAAGPARAGARGGSANTVTPPGPPLQPQPQARSPPRAASPQEGVMSRSSLGRSTSAGGENGGVSLTGSVGICGFTNIAGASSNYGSGSYSSGSPRPGARIPPTALRDTTPTPAAAAARAITPTTELLASRPATPRGAPVWRRMPQQVPPSCLASSATIALHSVPAALPTPTPVSGFSASLPVAGLPAHSLLTSTATTAVAAPLARGASPTMCLKSGDASGGGPAVPSLMNARVMMPAPPVNSSVPPSSQCRARTAG